MDPYHLTLTSAQAAYLQNYLPTCYSFQTATLQSKRQRAVKKIDESFTSEFTLLPLKKTAVSAKNNQHTSPALKTVENNQAENNRTEIKSHNQVKTTNKEIPNQTEMSSKKSEISLNVLIEKLLRMLKNCQYSWPFRNPVDPVAEGVTNPSESIDEQINLKKVEDKYKTGEYDSFEDFDEDIRKIISKSYEFYRPGTNYYAVTVEFQTFYLDAVKLNLKKSQSKIRSAAKLRENENTEKQIAVNEPVQKVAVSRVKTKENKAEKKNSQLCVGAKQKLNASESSLPMFGQKSPMKQLNFRERQRMFNKIDKLSQQNLRSFIKLCGVKTNDDWSQMEIDLADLSEEMFKKIETFLQEH